MRFDTQFLQAIKQRLDLRDLVEAELGQGKPSGQTMRWACPFHDGDNPTSFAVSAGHYQ